MTEYLKHRTEHVILLLFVVFALGCFNSEPETPSLTVDEIIELNRQIRIDTTEIDSTKV